MNAEQTNEPKNHEALNIGGVMARFCELHKKIEELANKKLDFSNENQHSYTSGKMHAYSHVWFEMKQILEDVNVP